MPATSETIAVLDIGTNAIRCDIRTHPFTNDHVVYRDKRMIRLGKTVFQTGLIDCDAENRLLAAIEVYSSEILRLGIRRVIAVATSALREAANRDAIIEGIKARFGIAIETISGEREAELIARGVLAFESDLPQDTVLFDIGGGSTEFIFCRGRSVLYSESLPIGALRFQQVSLKLAPPKPKDIDATRRSIREMLAPFTTQRLEGAALIGSGGNAKAVLRLRPKLNDSPNTISDQKLQAVLTELLPLDLAKLAMVPGMEPHRLEVIVAGSLILSEILTFFGARSIRVTEYTLRDGIYDELRQR